ncbi:MAG: hypothetical protein R3F59_00150 [Myxococcota bacterium]
MLWMPLGLSLAGAVGCSCRPQLPVGDDDDDDDNVTDTFSTTQTGDTGPPKPCAVPEEEPNDSLETANLLPMEKRGCGVIDAPLDVDHWAFDLADDAWLRVDALASTDGSIANMTFVLLPDEGSWAASRPNGPDTLDASLTFLAPAGGYSLIVSEEQLLGGPRYGYDVLVTEAKPPVEPWTRAEVEPNDTSDAAEPVNAGDVIYGTMDGNGALPDIDWYVITIPAGRHALNLDIDAYDVGSSANLSIFLWDPDLNALPEGCRGSCPGGSPGCVPCEIAGGGTPVLLDPEGSYDSLGAEIVYIQVRAEQNCPPSGNPCPDGPANWYTLHIDLEET